MLENKLSAIDVAIEKAIQQSRALPSLLKTLRKDAETGDIHRIRQHLADLGERLACLSEICAAAKAEAEFDVGEYLRSQEFFNEILEAANAAGVRALKGTDCLYSYPVAVRVDTQRKCLLIGKRRDTHMRPRFVAQELKRLQTAEGRIVEAVFLEILFAAYRMITKTAYSEHDMAGQVVPLTRVYEALTLLPDSAKTYSLNDFAVDVYRLDRSRLQRTRAGATLSLPASTGTRGSSGVLSVVSEDGEELRYFAISFSFSAPGGQINDHPVA